jgi:dienelactone hydrolase
VTLLTLAETDMIFTAGLRHQAEAVLAEGEVPYQITLFSGVEHGFAMRCDLTDRLQMWAKEEAFLQAVRWFELALA